MDIALSFHIGLMSRMLSRDPINPDENARLWVLNVARRLETASDNLDRAKEVEDVQAVGMRLRETLLTLTERLRSLELEVPPNVSIPEQDGNFKAWAEVYAGILASGSSSAKLRKALKGQSEHTWEYLGWLTHARNANVLDGRIAYILTSELVELFLLAIERGLGRQGNDRRCPACSSYQVSQQYAGDGNWLEVCFTCGWQTSIEQPAPTVGVPETGREPIDSKPQGECVVVEDFGIYLTPAQARSVLEEASAARSDEEEQPKWANAFAVRFPEDGSVHDVHRLVFAAHRHEPSPGSELVYGCTEESCVNPAHAGELPIPSATNWQPLLIERVVVGPQHLELQVAGEARGRTSIFVNVDFLTRFGIGDASSLLERVAFASDSDNDGRLYFSLGARRVDYSGGSIISASTRSS